MTIHLRDRMADELDLLGALGADLVPETVGTGRRRLRRRRLLEGAAVAVVVAAAAATLSTVAGPGTSGPAAPTGAVEVRTAWADQVADLFAHHLPDGFQEPVRADGPELEFLATGPRGEVRLNAEVYVDLGTEVPTCASTGAEECREVDLPDGAEATVLVNVYTNRPDLPQASQVWVTRPTGPTAIVNVVEVERGTAQLGLDDLEELATSDELSALLDLGAGHAGYLEGYGVNRPSR